MEVKAITGRSTYVFTKEPGGQWILYRHNRSYYHLIRKVTIKRWRKIGFNAMRYDPLSRQDVNTCYVSSASRVRKIIVDGKEVKSFTFE